MIISRLYDININIINTYKYKCKYTYKYDYTFCMNPLKYICVMSCRCCFPQDMVHTYVIQHVGLHKLRNSKTKEFFNLDDCGGPDCAQALEQNFTFVLELCATLSGADPWPRHKKFKAGLVHSVCVTISQVIYRYFLSICFFCP